jgi:DNA mismatch repair ATPase MutS
MFMGVLEKLRGVAEQCDARFASRAFRALFATVRRELDADYVATVRAHLEALNRDRGILLSAALGRGNEGTDYMLHQGQRPNWLERLVPKAHEYTFHIDPKDTAGATALGDIRDLGINAVANALAQSMDHIHSFFKMLRAEVGFYVGCANLHAALTRIGAPTCFPAPERIGARRCRCDGLYDPCLALSMGRNAVGNALNADGKRLIVITGANQGGKSSFLRAIGLAQLMMQAGMFVAAAAFSAELCSSVYTHYKREEDATMKSGKFDEELSRMSTIVDHMTPDSLMLFNESFASTNEREGSEIATGVVRALLERRIKVCFVTHLYEFAHGLFERKMSDAIFLRAERLEDGTRTFQLVEGEPLATSFGKDLYREIFAIESGT